MKAMLLSRLNSLDANPEPLALKEIPTPMPREGEILLRVTACGVCRTELDEIEGRTPPPRLPVVLGHQVVGYVEALGSGAAAFPIGQRVGVAWIFSACGECRFCRAGDENLCPTFIATGRDVNGGYAEYMTVPEAFAFAIPELLSDTEAAPLLCAGAIGYRSLRLANLGEGRNLGLTGFGASGHLVLQLARQRYAGLNVFVFARSAAQRALAQELGAAWVGDTDDAPPEPLDAIIDTTPAWRPVLGALRNLRPGGRLVINAIRKEAGDHDQLSRLDYAEHLWLEKEIKSVANVTRRDVREFLELAAGLPIRPRAQEFPLADANRALRELKAGRLRGAAVLRLD